MAVRTTEMERVRRIRLALLVAALLSSASSSASGQRTVAHPADGCVIREASRTPLSVDGREAYVEPNVVLPSGDDVLFAGRPNYLFTPGFTSDARGVARDSVFGVIIDRQGRSRLVPAPIAPALVASPRALPRAGGGWATVFAEMKHPWVPPRPDTIVRLWYGEYDGSKWSALEQLPEIPARRLDLEMGSELIRRGDSLYLAIIVETTTSSGDVAVFARHRGRWSVEIIPTITAVYAELQSSDSLGLLLVTAQSDRSAGRDANSLLLYGSRPGWALLRTLVRGGSQPAYDPRFTTSPEGTVLSWHIFDRGGQPPAFRARAMIGLSGAADGRVVELDPDITDVLPVAGFARFPLWVSVHNDPSGARTLRFLTDSAGGGRELASSPSPFTGFFAATAPGPSDILVSGPLFHADAARPRLVSLLIRARVECRTSAP